MIVVGNGDRDSISVGNGRFGAGDNTIIVGDGANDSLFLGEYLSGTIKVGNGGGDALSCVDGVDDTI